MKYVVPNPYPTFLLSFHKYGDGNPIQQQQQQKEEEENHQIVGCRLEGD